MGSSGLESLYEVSYVKFDVRISNGLPFPPSFVAPCGHNSTTTTIEITTPARKSKSPSVISTMSAVLNCMSGEAATDREILNHYCLVQENSLPFFIVGTSPLHDMSTHDLSIGE